MRLKSRLFYSYVCFLLVYSGFTLLPAPSPAVLSQYHIGVLALRLIDITIIVLLAGIWFAGFYGYAKLHSYTELIKDKKDGEQIVKLRKGIFLLVMWLPVSSVISSILNYLVLRHPGAISAVTIIDNYINVLLPLAGFVYVALGARGLSQLERIRPSFRATSIITVGIIYIGLIYLRLVATTGHRALVYHMSMWWILITLAAPYVYMWAIGIFATYELYLYSRRVAGIVYRKSWKFLAFGLGWLILTSICVQYLTSLVARLNGLSIYWILAIVYSLLLALSVGFVLIAFGSSKLQRIEEV